MFLPLWGISALTCQTDKIIISTPDGERARIQDGYIYVCSEIPASLHLASQSAWTFHFKTRQLGQISSLGFSLQIPTNRRLRKGGSKEG